MLPIGAMKWRLLIIVAALAAACAPSREAAFDPTRAKIEERTGHGTLWYEGDPIDREVDAAVAALLAEELTADAAAQIALLNNRALQARFEDIGIARANVVQATLLANPSISAELLFPVTADELQGGVGIDLDFLNSLFRSSRRGIALAELESTQLEVAGGAIDLSFEARAALVRYLAITQRVTILERSLEAAELSYEVAQRLRAAGNITDFTLLRERNLYETARLELVARKADLARARERVNRTLGLVGAQTRWTSASALPTNSDDGEPMEALVERAAERSIDLEVERRRIDVAGRTLGFTNARRLLPAFSIGVAGELEDDGVLAGPSASLTLPLLNQGQGDVARREAELRQHLDRYVATAVQLQAEARRVRDQYGIARERTTYLREVLLPLRTNLLTEAQLQYNAMTIGVFELLQAKRDQLEAELLLSEAHADALGLQLAAEQLLAGRMPSFELASFSNASAEGHVDDADVAWNDLGGDDR